MSRYLHQSVLGIMKSQHHQEPPSWHLEFSLVGENNKQLNIEWLRSEGDSCSDDGWREGEITVAWERGVCTCRRRMERKQ